MHCEFEKKNINQKILLPHHGDPATYSPCECRCALCDEKGLMECSAVRLRRLMVMGLLSRRVRPLPDELLGPVKLRAPVWLQQMLPKQRIRLRLSQPRAALPPCHPATHQACSVRRLLELVALLIAFIFLAWVNCTPSCVPPRPSELHRDDYTSYHLSIPHHCPSFSARSLCIAPSSIT